MINLIAACDRNRVIGKNGRLPWSIEEDWNYFLKTTAGGTMIMGKICYQEFEPFTDNREVIALTHDKSKKFEKAKTAHSLNHALSLSTKSTIWICGGEGLYKESMPMADNLYLTLINHSFDGDVFFPDWKKTFPKLISKNEVQTDKYSLEFLVFTKSSDIRS